MSYSPNSADFFRRAATYVDKILKGAKPARSPSGAAEEVRFHHQSQDRKADRPDVPPNVLATADKVIR